MASFTIKFFLSISLPSKFHLREINPINDAVYAAVIN